MEPETLFTLRSKGKQRQESDDDAASLSSSNSTNEQLKKVNKDATLICNSPIGTKNPIPLIFVTMVTQTALTITVQLTTSSLTTTTTVASTTTPQQQIVTAINMTLKRTPRSGPPRGGPPEGGKAPGEGASEGEQPANPNQYVIIPPANDICMMGSLPMVFKKIALILTLMQGEVVEGWTADIGTALDFLNPAQDNIPALWDKFLVKFVEQYKDTQSIERA